MRPHPTRDTELATPVIVLSTYIITAILCLPYLSSQSAPIHPENTMAAQNNRLILGLMTIGPDTSKGARITSVDEYKKCLDYLSSKGYDELDTAAVYVGGEQEPFTREAGFEERGFSIASKIMPSKPHDHKPERLRESWEASLSKLGVDCADILYLHAPDRTTSYEETLEGVDQLHKEGRFRKLGLSNYASWEVAEMVGICERR